MIWTYVFRLTYFALGSAISVVIAFSLNIPTGSGWGLILISAFLSLIMPVPSGESPQEETSEVPKTEKRHIENRQLIRNICAANALGDLKKEEILTEYNTPDLNGNLGLSNRDKG